MAEFNLVIRSYNFLFGSPSFQQFSEAGNFEGSTMDDFEGSIELGVNMDIHVLECPRNLQTSSCQSIWIKSLNVNWNRLRLIDGGFVQWIATCNDRQIMFQV